MANRAWLLLLLFAVSGCARGMSLGPEAAVREAVFRQQVAFWLDDHARESALVICLAAAAGGNSGGIDGSFLGNSRDRLAARPAEQCDARPSGAIERTTSRPAIIITVTAVTWAGPDEAVVDVEHFRSMVVSGRRKYRVIREQAEWVCLGQVLEMTPA